MNIVTSGLYNNSYKPEFRAGISKDTGTINLLNYALSPFFHHGENYDSAEYIYCLNANLKRIKSEDIIKIYERDYSKTYVWRDGTEKDFFIRNQNTGAIIGLTEKCNNGKYTYSALDTQVNEEVKKAENLAQALYYAITNNSSLGLLFGRKGAKKKADFIEPNSGIFEQNIEGLKDMKNKINELGETITSYESKIKDLRTKREDIMRKSENLQLNYVRNALDLQG